MSSRRVLIYGAGGRTGQAIAHECRKRGLDVVLAGREPSRFAPLAQLLACESRVARVEDTQALVTILRDVALVINAAGPYEMTASRVASACIAARRHYLDVNGEIDAYEHVANMHGSAFRNGVLLMPGAGFCVVASTFMLARLLKNPKASPPMDEPTHVRIAFSGGPASSIGSIKSLYTSLLPGVDIVRDGRRASVPIGSLERAFDFGAKSGGRLDCTAISVADTQAVLYDAPRTLRQIETYVEGGLATRTFFDASGRLTNYTKVQPWKAYVERAIDRWPATPDSGVDTRCAVYVEVANPWLQLRSEVRAARSTYAFTTIIACTLAESIVAGVGVRPGFHTPSSLFADLPAVAQCFDAEMPPPTALRAAA